MGTPATGTIVIGSSLAAVNAAEMDAGGWGTLVTENMEQWGR